MFSLASYKILSVFLVIFLVLLFFIFSLERAYALDARVFLDLLLKTGIIPIEKESAARALLEKEEGRMSATTPAGFSFSSVCPFVWTRDLVEGMSGNDVRRLQQFLNTDSATQLALTGPGAPGEETFYFGPKTKAAVTIFQEKYMSDILAPVGATAGTGYFGAASREKANALCKEGEQSQESPTLDLPPDTAEEVEQPKQTSQPAKVVPEPGLTITRSDSLGEFVSIPHDTKEVDFGSFDFKAGGHDITISGMSIERFGTGEETTDIAYIWVLVDGKQKSNPKNFSKNIAFIAFGGDTIEIPANWTAKVTIKGALSSDAKIGNFSSLGISGIDSNSTLKTTLPVKGPLITISSKTSP